MSIITKRGDDGMTDCLYGDRINKSSLRIEAIGALDELNAWIGFSAFSTQTAWSGNFHLTIQKDLISIMGELSAGPDNLGKYKKQFGVIDKSNIIIIEDTVKKLEIGRKFNDWANPESPWDISCRICRRAERALLRYSEDTDDAKKEEKVRKEVLIYMNRLSDLLWIWGRK